MGECTCRVAVCVFMQYCAEVNNTHTLYPCVISKSQTIPWIILIRIQEKKLYNDRFG